MNDLARLENTVSLLGEVELGGWVDGWGFSLLEMQSERNLGKHSGEVCPARSTWEGQALFRT